MIDVEEFLESFSAPVSLFFVFIVDDGVSSSDVVSEEGMFDVHFVLIRAACVHREIDDCEVFVFDVLIGDFFDGVGILIEGFVDEVRFGDDLFELSKGSELFFFFFSSDGVSLNLLVFFL